MAAAHRRGGSESGPHHLGHRGDPGHPVSGQHHRGHRLRRQQRAPDRQQADLRARLPGGGPGRHGQRQRPALWDQGGGTLARLAHRTQRHHRLRQHPGRPAGEPLQLIQLPTSRELALRHYRATSGDQSGHGDPRVQHGQQYVLVSHGQLRCSPQPERGLCAGELHLVGMDRSPHGQRGDDDRGREFPAHPLPGEPVDLLRLALGFGLQPEHQRLR